MKAMYDYGLLITILTLSMVSVSGYHDDDVINTAVERISTILIGNSIVVLVGVLICPVWAGDDLRNLVANSIEKLGNFLEGREWLKKFKFARWEWPRCLQFGYPWKNNQKLGALARQCACRIEALNGYLQAKDRPPQDVKNKIEEICTMMNSESGKALKELSLATKTMTQPSLSVILHVQNLEVLTLDLNSTLAPSLWEDSDITEIISATTVTSLFMDVVACTEKIAESVQELAFLAHFENADHFEDSSGTKSNLDDQVLEKQQSRNNGTIVIRIEGSAP
ncbi:hypothetical protein Ancab_007483 [Ancistrocladus abbreviatus]